MTHEDYQNQQVDRIKTWFKDHEARIVFKNETTEKMVWQNRDGSGIFKINYLVDDGRLICTGDLGEQVYSFYRDLSLSGFGDNYHYYMTKAVNVNGHQCSLEFCKEHAKEWMRESACDHEVVDVIQWDDLSVEEHFDEFEFYREYSDDIDLETLQSIVEAGKTLNMRMISHFIGLHMANEQLAEIKTI